MWGERAIVGSKGHCLWGSYHCNASFVADSFLASAMHGKSSNHLFMPPVSPIVIGVQLHRAKLFRVCMVMPI